MSLLRWEPGWSIDSIDEKFKIRITLNIIILNSDGPMLLQANSCAHSTLTDTLLHHPSTHLGIHSI